MPGFPGPGRCGEKSPTAVRLPMRERRESVGQQIMRTARQLGPIEIASARDELVSIGQDSPRHLVWSLGLSSTPSVFDQPLISWSRVGAAGLSLALAIALESLANVHHPPAASTTLLLALGSFRPTWHDGATILAGVVVVTLAAELFKRLRSSLGWEHYGWREGGRGRDRVSVD
jgi:hypothetical protein